ncbi:MAG: hypothetical protein WC415_02365 [Patescibacteria group bacterium]|jgi:hypothetical protein
MFIPDLDVRSTAKINQKPVTNNEDENQVFDFLPIAGDNDSEELYF